MTARVLPLVSDLGAGSASLASGVLDWEAGDRVARVFRARGDGDRVRLLSLTAAADGGEACVCDLAAPVGLPQPTVSRQVEQLAGAGLVARGQRGRCEC